MHNLAVTVSYAGNEPLTSLLVKDREVTSELTVL